MNLVQCPDCGRFNDFSAVKDGEKGTCSHCGNEYSKAEVYDLDYDLDLEDVVCVIA